MGLLGAPVSKGGVGGAYREMAKSAEGHEKYHPMLLLCYYSKGKKGLIS